MNIPNAIFQGIVQGLTEFLPVSSSGHLTIYQHIFSDMQDNNLFFSVMLHIGTLTAVIAVYFRLVLRLLQSLGSLIKKIFTRNFKWQDMSGDENLAMMIVIGLIPIFLLFLPIPASDMKVKDLADKFSKDGYFIVVGLSLICTSVLLFLGNRKNKKTIRQKGKTRKRIKLPDALVVGFTQCFAAVFPGLSRSGSTLAASQMRGINKQVALDYSFLLGTPAIVAAAVLEGKDAFSSHSIADIGYFPVIIGMIVSAFVGFFAIKFFKWLLSTDRMYIFILYTAVTGGIISVISIIELCLGINIFTQNPLTF